MNLSDESGNLRLALCFLNFFINHGLRDYLITALPSIASELTPVILQTVTEINNQTYSPQRKWPNLPDNDKTTSFYESSTTHVDVLLLNEEEGWTPITVGLILSLNHWTWAISLLLGTLFINPEKKKEVIIVNLVISGVIALLTQVATGAGPIGLGCMRALLGFSQGLCYPLTYYILSDMNNDNFVFPYFVIFLAPWLGSAFGVLLGTVSNQFYLGSYVFGFMCLLLAILSLFLPLQGEKLSHRAEVLWKEILSSVHVWSSILVQLASVWALHTFLVGVSFSLYFQLKQEQMIWIVCVIVLIGGVTTRIVALVAKYLMRTNGLSTINRRRVVITSGSIIIVVTLLINAIVGVDSTWALCVSSLVGICGGTCLCLVGNRLNLHDMCPSFPMPILTLASCGAAIGAAFSSITFPVLAQVGSSYNIDDSSYKIAWVVPIAIVCVASSIHLFLVSTNPLPYQITIGNMNGSVPKENGDISTIFRSVSDPLDLDTKSFKSLRSGVSFKTAVSHPWTARSASFKTINDDFQDVDLRSIVDSDEDRSVKTAQEEAEELEIRSIKSGTSFRSAADENRVITMVVDVNKINQTQDWLRTAHNTGKEFAKEIAIQKKRVEKNVLMATLW